MESRAEQPGRSGQTGGCAIRRSCVGCWSALRCPRKMRAGKLSSRRTTVWSSASCAVRRCCRPRCSRIRSVLPAHAASGELVGVGAHPELRADARQAVGLGRLGAAQHVCVDPRQPTGTAAPAADGADNRPARGWRRSRPEETEKQAGRAIDAVPADEPAAAAGAAGGTGASAAELPGHGGERDAPGAEGRSAAVAGVLGRRAPLNPAPARGDEPSPRRCVAWALTKPRPAAHCVRTATAVCTSAEIPAGCRESCLPDAIRLWNLPSLS